MARDIDSYWFMQFGVCVALLTMVMIPDAHGKARQVLKGVLRRRDSDLSDAACSPASTPPLSPASSASGYCAVTEVQRYLMRLGPLLRRDWAGSVGDLSLHDDLGGLIALAANELDASRLDPWVAPEHSPEELQNLALGPLLSGEERLFKAGAWTPGWFPIGGL